MARVTSMIAAAGLITTATADVLFYGGDADERNGLSSEQNTSVSASMVYDDFSVATPVIVQEVWGNFQMDFTPSSSYYEIRSGVSAGNGGTLVTSGYFSPTITATGRTPFGWYEYQVFGSVSFSLSPGTYWIGIAPVDAGSGRAFVSTTSGADLGPAGDPNPIPTGTPLANGNSFFDSAAFGSTFTPVDDANILGAGPWDFSYGLGMVPEPSHHAVVAALGLLAYGFLRRRA